MKRCLIRNRQLLFFAEVAFRPINTVGLPATVLEIGSGVMVVGKVMGKAFDVGTLLSLFSFLFHFLFLILVLLGKMIPGINRFYSSTGDDDDEESWSDESDEADDVSDEADDATYPSLKTSSCLLIIIDMFSFYSKSKKTLKKMSVTKTYHVTLAKVLPMIKAEQDFIAEFFRFKDVSASPHSHTLTSLSSIT